MNDKTVLTGKQIVAKWNGLNDELKGLEQACEMVSNELGEDTTAFKALDKLYKDKARELVELEETEFKNHIIIHSNQFFKELK